MSYPKLVLSVWIVSLYVVSNICVISSSAADNAAGAMNDQTQIKATETKEQSDDLYQKVKLISKETATFVSGWDAWATIKSDAKFSAKDTELKQLKKNIDDAKKMADELYSQTIELKNEINKAKNPDYKTKYFMLNVGATTLNPYKIIKDENNNFILASTGENDTRFYTEATFKFRRAWLGPEGVCTAPVCLSGETRIGFTDGKNKQAASVVSGSGDTYFEVNIGPDWSILDSKSTCSATSPFIRFGPDVLYGVVTDKVNQTSHEYRGLGGLLSFAAPTNASRFLSGLVGIYYGRVDVPHLHDDNTTVLYTRRNTFPEFRAVDSVILRTEARLPIGDSGYVTLNGLLFRLQKQHGDLPAPWTVSLGYTIPIDSILESIISIPKAIIKQ